MSNRPQLPGSNLYGLSQNLWRDIPTDMIFGQADRRAGIGFFDDFLFGTATSLYSGYIKLLGSGCTATVITSEANHFGIMRLLIDGNAADDEAVIQAGLGIDVGPYKFAATPLVFEAYIRPSAVTAAKWSWFCGLATGGAAGAAITDLMFADASSSANALYATNSFVGFLHLTAASTDVDGMYQVSGTAEVTGVEDTDLDAIATIAANTWIKLGIRYDPHPQRVGWWVDGTEVAHIDDAAIEAANFPDAVFLQPTFGAKDSVGTALNLDLDWWACAQLTA